MSWKFFNPGQILTADDANTLMRQGRAIVANATERNAISAVEGQRVYQLDNKTEYEFISGSWVGGWTPYPLNGPDAAEFVVGVALEWKLANGIVFHRGRLDAVAASIPTGWKNVATLPAVACPNATSIFAGVEDATTSDGSVVSVSIQPSGAVNIRAGQGIITRAHLNNVVYPR
ncbi:hypothetical protein [Microbacterium sp. AR7-10]|uniref:hypothetical protein n=1 Tax=Microbacterium sp. AR7-10 TaxID=1891970 RepID=UPI0008FC64DC|nr:hypothetical protein [Microbacterium sp. AR7-10]OIU84605.1 hypothetical protein BFN01_02120 [Microbacterium sp. AR7-10]